jgi:DNA-binding CsgD family transcriptional regulator
MSGELTTLGVDSDAERVYRRILRSAPATVDAHLDAFGWERSRADAAYQALLLAGLVTQTDAGVVETEAPGVAIGRLIAAETDRLEARRRELDDVASSIAGFSHDHHGVAPLDDSNALELVPADVVVSVLDEIVRTTTGTIRSAVRSASTGPGGDEAIVRLVQGQISRGRVMRSMYPVSLTRSPGVHGILLLRAWADVGEEQRMIDDVPHEFTVFGDEVVLASSQWGVVTDDRVAIRSPLLIQMFTTMFDESWKNALPVPDSGAMLDTDDRLLALLASGLKDEAIARYLNVSLRTVRRRVSALMDQLGAQTRFQLGIAAERRGLLKTNRR